MKTQAIKPIERAWFEFIKRLPCCVCGSYLDIEAHHITYAGRRLGHLFSLPLCIPCHRGERGFSGGSRSDWDKGIVFQINKLHEICQVYNYPIPELPYHIPQLQQDNS